MRLLSFRHNSTGCASWGAFKGEQIVDLGALTGIRTLGAALRVHTVDDLEPICRDVAAMIDPASVSYLPVITDNVKIFCIGLNYEEHRVEAGRGKTSEPTVFARFASSQTGHGQPLVIPLESDKLDYEGEIAIVIGKGGRRIAEAEAWTHIAGYAPYNDGSVRDWQAHGTQWLAGKNFPATGAFGPVLVSRSEIRDGEELTLVTRLNGQEVQRSTTAHLTFPIPQLIAYCSTFSGLEPGDVIVTGTPGGVGFKRNPPLFMKDGDMVEVEVTSLGTLVNPVMKELAK